MSQRRAVFLDRDDTINRDVPYCARPEDFVLLPTVSEGLKLLNAAGLVTVVVTNQSGVARGLFTEGTLHRIHEHMHRLLAADGARIDAVYNCLHHPDADCPCRKPKTALVDRAAKDLGLDPQRSFVIGDRPLDMLLARNIGAVGVMVPTERGQKELREASEEARPAYLARDFADAARWVVGRL